eukprot:GHVS01012353.1.p1 GENE.GHVS01012353.1~~GHVS01012353.1.p1  ORF type:complete len:319 (-),score=7.87 GHVS01012353.1:462-1418(-)
MQEVILETDASDVGMGSVLKEKVDGEERVIEFASKKLSPTQQRWSAREREAYAIKWGLDYFFGLVRGARITLRTDDLGLVTLNAAENSKVFRWALYVQQFNLHIENIKGTDNVLADFLSRAPREDDEEENAAWEKISTPMVDAWPVERAPMEIQQENLHVRLPIIPSLEELRKASIEVPATEAKHLYLAPDELRYNLHTHRLWVPPQYRKVFLFWYHSGAYGGHHGVNRTSKPGDTLDFSNCLPRLCGPSNVRRSPVLLLRHRGSWLRLRCLASFRRSTGLIHRFDQKFGDLVRQELGIRWVQNTPGYPQGNGLSGSC